MSLCQLYAVPREVANQLALGAVRLVCEWSAWVPVSKNQDQKLTLTHALFEPHRIEPLPEFDVRNLMNVEIAGKCKHF